MTAGDARLGALAAAVDPERLVRTAYELVAIPSPTRQARAVADRLAEILAAEGFAVERPVANWPESPAVVACYRSGRTGRTLQFSGHLDTIHLPFVPPKLENGVLSGSGSADMKGGLAAAVEAMRALRDTGALEAGEILFTAYDHQRRPLGRPAATARAHRRRVRRRRRSDPGVPGAAFTLHRAGIRDLPHPALPGGGAHSRSLPAAGPTGRPESRRGARV